MNPEHWIIVAVAAYWLYFLAIFEAFKPNHRDVPGYPKDIYWVKSIQPESETDSQ